MAKLVVKGKNIDVTPALKEFITKKLSKLEKYAQHIVEITVEMHVERNPRISASQVVDVNIFANGAVLRAEEASHDMYASIDMVIDKLDRQMKKYEERKMRHKTGNLKISQVMADDENKYVEEKEDQYSTY